MSKFGPSINDRWKKICEEMSAGAVTAGDGGFTGAADPLGPVAGYENSYFYEEVFLSQFYFLMGT